MVRSHGAGAPLGIPGHSLRVRDAEWGKGRSAGGKRLGSRGPEQVTEKQRGSEGVQAARRAAGATLALALALASQTQGGRVLFGFQSEIRDAGVLAGSLGGSCGGHDGGGRS